MSATAFLFATLIGVFITPDGIVVGSDTALSSRAGQTVGQKYCATGPRAVATMQGVYQLKDTETNATVALYDHFRDFCARIDHTQLPSTIQGQAEFIAEALRTALERFLRDVPTEEVVSKYASSPIVARVAVSGYDDSGPSSAVVALGVATDVAEQKWEAQIHDLRSLTFRHCGVRFHGQEVVVLALRRDADKRIPALDRGKSDAKKLSALIGGTCSDVSIQSAPTLFAEAARLTIAHGSGFGIQPGIVNLPLDIIVIPRAGALSVSRVESWQP